PLEEALSELRRAQAVTDEHDADGEPCGEASIETKPAAFLDEQRAVPLQRSNALRLFVHFTKRCQSGCSDRRRHADAEHECRGMKTKDVYERPASRDVAPAAAQRLAECSHPNIDAGGRDRKMLEDASPGTPQHAECVRLINHQPRIVPLLDGNQL